MLIKLVVENSLCTADMNNNLCFLGFSKYTKKLKNNSILKVWSIITNLTYEISNATFDQEAQKQQYFNGLIYNN